MNQQPNKHRAAPCAAKATDPIFLPTVFIPVSLHFWNSFNSCGVYGEDTSTLLTPRYSYNKIFITRATQSGGKIPSRPEIVTSHKCFCTKLVKNHNWNMCSPTTHNIHHSEKTSNINPETLEKRNNSWIPFASAIAVCMAQATGSVPKFTISCTRQWLQRIAGYSSEYSFFRIAPSGKIIISFFILKQVVKLSMTEVSPHCILTHAVPKVCSLHTDCKPHCPHAPHLTRQQHAQLLP